MENAPPAEPAKPAEAAPQPYSVGTAPEKPKSEWRDLASFLVKLALIVFVVRSFIFSPFSIPSESMMPRLLIGDYLFITKWNYGYSRHSLPWSLPLIPGRIFGSTPERGDVVVFKAPPTDNTDWIKRVIGLPGDSVQMVHGQIILNGKPVPKQRIAQFVLPLTPNFGRCPTASQSMDAEGNVTCSIPRFRETLPNGKTYDVLDLGLRPQDDTGVYTVPAGHVFLMGDNRDNSTDSRFSHEEGGIEFVPLENIEGKAVVSFWSTDGNANWFLPWTWFTAARWSRIGEGF
ncbi:signal peptidase I [Sphingomonas hengshuiensis]|uniref:Signal peptidase I n=1 Tax=Sphingomonas hengshuiensis TaxID=1609977 RepID=A0A7U5CUR7_9SPHN|nr:signal peptidase I [Sphingomonas hengshuiensis]AJP70849.1 signal peptidase [Sphingomonas hengshuiensis]